MQRRRPSQATIWTLEYTELSIRERVIVHTIAEVVVRRYYV